MPAAAAAGVPQPLRDGREISGGVQRRIASRFRPRAGGAQPGGGDVKTVFVDVDTQFDFILPAGALYAPGAEKILPLVSALNQYAGANGIPLISTVDAHTENEAEFRHWHPHCVAGTLSQQKPASTLLGKRAVNERAAGVQQIIVEKRSYDPFTNPKFAAILDELGGERCVVYGLVTDICVKY